MTVSFYFKRIFGLVGAIRVGKDSVANFLSETRDFKQLAFADQIKKEFGISKEDFEAAKIAGNIEELRKELWSFSAEKRKNNPRYFVDKVIEEAKLSEQSIVITDIRTEEELSAFYGIRSCKNRIYWVRGGFEDEFDDKDCLSGSKLSQSVIAECLSSASKHDMCCVYNDKESGLYKFYQKLDKYFFLEDIKDLWENPTLRGNLRLYVDQFDIRHKS